jgi:hypothetical protein
LLGSDKIKGFDNRSPQQSGLPAGSGDLRLGCLPGQRRDCLFSRRHAEEIQRFNARPGDLTKGKPVIILINGGSAYRRMQYMGNAW